jgi:hypothetical protein
VTPAATVFRRLYGPGAAKRIARAHRVSPSAAKKWLAGDWPSGRLAAGLEHGYAELERQLAELAELEAALDTMAGDWRRVIQRPAKTQAKVGG